MGKSPEQLARQKAQAIASGPESKRCSRCREKLPFERFWDVTKRRISAYCRVCLQKQRNTRRANRRAQRGLPPKIRPSRNRYEAYLKSPEWKQKRLEYWESGRPRECYVCEFPWVELYGWRIQLHHRTYQRLYAEDLDDLVPVCPACHDRIGRAWEAAKKNRSDESLTLWEVTERVRTARRAA